MTAAPNCHREAVVGTELNPTGARPLLLDLFCGAGGAAAGYYRAGFDVVGVDVDPQPNYPYSFVRADALEVLGELAEHDPRFAIHTRHGEIRAIHASPPCQHSTAYKRRPNHVKPCANLIGPVRRLLRYIGLPYVIENVPGARSFMRMPETLCGSSFGLDVRRHRLFETSWRLTPRACDHAWQTPRFPPATNRQNLRRTVEVGVWRIPLPVQQAAMEIDWMTLPELSQAIPPAFTDYVGQQLLAVVEGRAAA